MMFKKIASSAVVKGSKLFFLVVLMLVLCFSCCKPEEEDIVKLKELENNFNDRYKFSFSVDGIYLYAKLKKDAVIQYNDDEEIYKKFMFKNIEKKERRKTSYVYLNLYDSEGKFLYQIFYDTKSNKFMREYRTEHY